MFRITKQFGFSASHQLFGLAEGHPCSRLHGHNYRVELILEGEPDARGFVFDYNDLAPFGRMIDDRLDHRHLNEVLPLQPSAENLARWLHGEALRLGIPAAAVRVSETEKTWAEYRPS